MVQTLDKAAGISLCANVLVKGINLFFLLVNSEEDWLRKKTDFKPAVLHLSDLVSHSVF